MQLTTTSLSRQISVLNLTLSLWPYKKSSRSTTTYLRTCGSKRESIPTQRTSLVACKPRSTIGSEMASSTLLAAKSPIVISSRRHLTSMIKYQTRGTSLSTPGFRESKIGRPMACATGLWIDKSRERIERGSSGSGGLHERGGRHERGRNESERKNRREGMRIAMTPTMNCGENRLVLGNSNLH